MHKNKKMKEKIFEQIGSKLLKNPHANCKKLSEKEEIGGCQRKTKMIQ